MKLQRALVSALVIALPLTASAVGVPAALAGEWSAGSISPIEYYNAATGKWADASGVSTLLKIRPDGTYEKTGLLSVTTYGCTSKLFVQEKGAVAVRGDAVTFTPKTSYATGYTCSPGKTYEKRDHVAAHTERWSVEAGDRPVLRLAQEGGATLYNRR